MEIYTTMEPYELAENVSDEMEAVYICAEILRRWSLEQPAYALILDEIPDFAIKQYLRRLRQMEKDHCETLSEMLKKNNNNTK